MLMQSICQMLIEYWIKPNNEPIFSMRNYKFDFFFLFVLFMKVGLIFILYPRNNFKWLIKLNCFTLSYSILIVFQLPRMLETDPVARYYGLEKGQVVKVTYSGEFIDSLLTYRAVLWCFY